MSTDVTNQRRTPFQLENLIASSGITNPESAESTRAATPLNPGTPVSEKETFVVNLSTENHPVLSQSEKPSLPHEGESAIPEDVQVRLFVQSILRSPNSNSLTGRGDRKQGGRLGTRSS